jgi:hypothetical protein
VSGSRPAGRKNRVLAGCEATGTKLRWYDVC